MISSSPPFWKMQGVKNWSNVEIGSRGGLNLDSQWKETLEAVYFVLFLAYHVTWKSRGTSKPFSSHRCRPLSYPPQSLTSPDCRSHEDPAGLSTLPDFLELELSTSRTSPVFFSRLELSELLPLTGSLRPAALPELSEGAEPSELRGLPKPALSPPTLGYPWYPNLLEPQRSLRYLRPPALPRPLQYPKSLRRPRYPRSDLA